MLQFRTCLLFVLNNHRKVEVTIHPMVTPCARSERNHFQRVDAFNNTAHQFLYLLSRHIPVGSY